MDKKWLIPPGLNAEEVRAIQSLSAELKVPELVAELIYRRGLHNMQDIREFSQSRSDTSYRSIPLRGHGSSRQTHPEGG